MEKAVETGREEKFFPIFLPLRADAQDANSRKT